MAKETRADIEAYREAADAADVKSIRLVSSNFDIKPDAFTESDRSWKQVYRCDTVSAQYDKDQSVLFAFIEAAAICKIGNRNVISLKCNYIVSYIVHGNPEKVAAERFARHVGRFAAYPYFRAHFAELTSQAGLNLPPLPVMREGKRLIGRSDSEPVGTP